MRPIFQVRPEKTVSISFIALEFSDLNVDGFVILIWRIIITLMKSVSDGLVSLFANKEARNVINFTVFSCFSIWVFSCLHWQLTRQQRIGRKYIYRSLPLPPNSNFLFYVWNDNILYWRAAHVSARLLVEC